MEHFITRLSEREKLRYHILQRMAEYNGTVFLYAHSNEFEKEAFSQAAMDFFEEQNVDIDRIFVDDACIP